MTINQEVQQFRTIATNHDQINTFGFGLIPEFGKASPIIYPVMWGRQLPSTKDGNALVHNYEFLFADLVHKDLSNELEVSSDQMEVALDVLAQLSHPDYEWSFEIKSDLEPVFGDLDDEVTGWKVRFGLTHDSPYNRCQIPFTPAPVIEGEPGYATVYAADGITVLFTVSNNGFYIYDQTTGMFQELELQSGIVDGTNAVFVFDHDIIQLFVDGQLVYPDITYTAIGGTVTFITPPFLGSELKAFGNF